MNRREEVAQWAGFIKGLGFRVWLAESGTYGFISDGTESRVLSFGSEGGLSGNYDPSAQAGSGWRMDQHSWDLKTAEDVRAALYATAPSWARRPAGSDLCQCCGQVKSQSGKPWGYTTVKQHLAMYGSSSKYREL